MPMALNQYLYVRNNGVNWIVPFGLWTIAVGGELKLPVEMHGEMTIATMISANWRKHFLDLDQIRADDFSKLSYAPKSAIAGIIGDFI